METSYKNISFFFIGILLCALIGFHQTYTTKFPTFEGLTTAHHFHGAMLMSWFAMLIVQPFLIRTKKYELHRNLGKLGYILAPLVCFSIFLLTKLVYFREIAHRPVPEVLGQISLDIPTIFLFGFFFVLAMANRKDSSVHMRYMIATSFLMIGPGLGRALIIYGHLPFPVAVSAVIYISEIIAAVFLAFDFFKKRNIKPFLTVFVLLVLNHICWAYQMSGWWQASTGAWSMVCSCGSSTSSWPSLRSSCSSSCRSCSSPAPPRLH